MRSSPRASIGLIMLPASMAPSAAPAPTMVCSSSMKVMTSPSASAISFRTAFSRSSNSPRYLAPAIIEPRSRLMTRLPFRPSGTSPSTMRWARPSTMAVLPTPGSPMSTGLFLVRRDSTWMTRRISSSRPMTGSSFPWRASAVRSRPYFSRAWNVSSGFWEVTRWLPRTSRRADSRSSRSTPRRSARARSRCSTDRYSSPMSPRCASAGLERLPQGRGRWSARRRRRPGAAGPAARRSGRAPRPARRPPGRGWGRRSRRPGRGRRPAGGRGRPRRWWPRGRVPRPRPTPPGSSGSTFGVEAHRAPPISVRGPSRGAGRARAVADSGTRSRRYCRWVTRDRLRGRPPGWRRARASAAPPRPAARGPDGRPPG